MCRELLDVDDDELVGSGDPADRRQREIREVLVIDRVELVALHEPNDMRELKRRDAARPEEDARCRPRSR